MIHPLHRAKLAQGVAKLRDRDLLEVGAGFGALGGTVGAYMALLDADRVKIVARLKESFDRPSTKIYRTQRALSPPLERSAFHISQPHGLDAHACRVLCDVSTGRSSP